MKKQTKERPLKLHPIEVRILRKRWQSLGLDAQLHAMTGNSANSIMGKAGSLFWVVLWAAAQQGIEADAPDLRMIRGAVNTLGDVCSIQALSPQLEITELQRGAVAAGLYAVDRLAPTMVPEKLFIGALMLQTLASQRPITIEDFIY